MLLVPHDRHKISDVLMKTIADLPYDILHHIFDLLPARDLTQLLYCCRTLYALTQQESVWRSLCASNGLHDIARFGGRSWFTIYTRLLHPYGPMLGLWAGDHPYTGSILDVRLCLGDNSVQGGIVVDMWQFRILQPEELDGPEEPEPPILAPLLRIDFSRTASLYGDPHVICCSSKRGNAPPHSATLRLFSPMMQSTFVHTRQGQHTHPDFPSADSFAWVDDDRRRTPRLPVNEALVVDQTAEVRSQRPRIPIVFSAPRSGYRSPPAVSISCAHGCVERSRPFLGFDNRIPALPRYYPLRHAGRRPPRRERGDDAELEWTSSWSPGSLVGLWLGSHGPHGTEALYVQWSEASSTLGAWKITGDENVPRGAVSWEAHMDRPVVVDNVSLPTTPPDWSSAMGDLSVFRLFEGTGTISARGFFSHQRNSTRIVLAVPLDDANTLRVGWIDMEEVEVSAYIRVRRAE